MNTPAQSGTKPMLSKPPLKAPAAPAIPRVLSPDEEDDPQEDYLPMQPGSPEIEPEDYEAPGDVVMPDGTTLGEGVGGFPDQDELYEELPAEDNPQGDDTIEPEEYEDPSATTSPSPNLNQMPLPPKPSVRVSPDFEEPGYQSAGIPAEENTDNPTNPEPWQYAKTLKDKKISTSDLKNADCKGVLEKLGGRGHNTWQKRYCVLDNSLLYFFKDEKSKNFNNFIEAFAYNVSEAEQMTKEKKHQFSFVLTCHQSGKDYYFRTTSSEDRERWMNALKKCAPPSNFSTQQHGLTSMHTLKHSTPTIEPAGAPAAEEFQCEYEDVPAPSDRIQSEGESDEERFESKRQPPPPHFVPKMPPPAPPPVQDQLYDEHPVEADDPEEDYLACEGPLQQDIIESAASPVQIVVDTERIYEATEDGVNLENVYVSLYNFTAEEEDEMSLQRGDLVWVVDNSSSPNWWLAELVTPDIVKTNKRGYCPANFLTLAFEQV